MLIRKFAYFLETYALSNEIFFLSLTSMFLGAANLSTCGLQISDPGNKPSRVSKDASTGIGNKSRLPNSKTYYFRKESNGFR